MKYLVPIPKQFVDQSGIPLSNGTVHVYISGGTQYANVYQDADGEELMPNPARLDSNGAWLGFVTSGVPLDYVVKDNNGNVQFEYEKVIAGDGIQSSDIEPLTFVCPKYEGITGFFEYLVTTAKTIFSRLLVFKYRNEVIGSYQPLDDSNSLAEEIVIPEESFILQHSSMSVPLTDEEFDTCRSKFLAGIAVSIQYASGGISKCDLIQITTGGSLEFSYCQNGSIVTFTISPNSPHTIFPAIKTIPNPDSTLNVTLGGQTKIYTPTGPNLSLDIDNEVSRIYLAKGDASVSTLNAGIPGIQNGWSYVMTDSGTLTLGSVSVSAGDNVAWDGSKWFKVGNQVNINVLYVIQNDEYLYAITDSNGALLFSITKDGSVDWEKGIPEHIRKSLEQIFEIIPTKVDKVTGKGLIDSTFADEISIISNEEYLFAIVDSLDRILFSINKRGEVDFQSGLPDSLAKYVEELDKKEDSVPGKSLVNSIFADGISDKPDLVEYAYVITDNSNRVLFGIDKKTGKISGYFENSNVEYFDTVAELKKSSNQNLKFARTLGFYEIGDGGGALYKVGEGAENGFSTFDLASGLAASLVIEDNYLYPEQVGYTNKDTSKDLRTYLFYITRDLKVDCVRLYNKQYYQNGPWIVPRQGISIIGSANSGNQQDDGKYYFTRILYSSTRTDNGACVYNCEYREFRLENVEIRNLDAEDPSKPPRIGILTLQFHDDPLQPDYHTFDHYDMIIKNCRINNFEYGLNLSGNIKWNLQIDNVRCSSCTYGCRIYGHALVASFRLFYPDHCDVGVQIETLAVAVSFLYCNFGTINKAIVIDKSNEPAAYGQFTFIGCNFELDEAPVENKSALFVDVSAEYKATLTLIGCNFNMSKLADSAYSSGCYGIALGDETEASLIGCQLYNAPLPSNLFNPSSPAKLKLGSVSVSHSDGIVIPAYSDQYLPTFSLDGCIHTRQLNTLDIYYSLGNPGTIVCDENTDKAYVKLLSTYKEV